MLDTAESIRCHVEYKRGARELKEDVADRMLAALAGGAEPDYRALLHAAVFINPPALVFHTAPCARRKRIASEGLRVCQPGQGGSWATSKPVCEMLQAAQPPGVYVDAQPDVRGVWSHWPAWDVWQVTLGALPWAYDELNPGCWSVRADVAAGAVRLLGSYGTA